MSRIVVVVVLQEAATSSFSAKLDFTFLDLESLHHLKMLV